MLILDMQEGTELESPRTAPPATDGRCREPESRPVPALQLQEHCLAAEPHEPDPELVRGTLAHYLR